MLALEETQLNPLIRSLRRKASLITLCLSISILTAACQVIALVPYPTTDQVSTEATTTETSTAAATEAPDKISPEPVFPIPMSQDELMWRIARSTNLFEEVPPVSPVPTVTLMPTPITSVAPTVSPTPLPTATPVPTSTPKPTATPVPTATPTLKPTATPVPTASPTPMPTAIPAPTATPTPTPKPDPSLCVVNLPGVPINWPATVNQQQKANQLIDLVNEERVKNGLPALITGSSSLQQMAYVRAADLSALFSHSRPTNDINSDQWYYLMSPLSISYRTAGENLASVPSRDTSPQSAFDGLKGSAGHYKNMMSGFSQIAVGVYTHEGADLYAMVLISTWSD